MPRPRATPAPSPLPAAALSAAVGAALVLDAELRVVLATREAQALLGSSPAAGASAVQLLCKQSPLRPLAQALAEGRSIEALIAHPSGASSQGMLKIRALPLGEAAPPQGFLLLLDRAPAHGEEPLSFHGMWSQSPVMKEVFRVIERVAAEDVTVLVRGETGTGKELVATAIHALSPRRAGPFRAINCAALPASLLESELFGHVRGAFTGAIADSPGHFELAHQGTLFLDEVGEMPPEVQAKLLRVLETRSVLPVGGRRPIPVDVRIVSATHRSLREEVEQGRFRADLMYRLRVIPIFLPALRERPGDIPLLCDKLLEGMNRGARRRIEGIGPGALAVLERYAWPGNVRELRNVLSYAYAIGDGPILQTGDLPKELLPSEIGVPGSSVVPAPRGSEARRILQTLEKAGGNRQRAARILGMSRVTLWRRLRALGLEPH